MGISKGPHRNSFISVRPRKPRDDVLTEIDTGSTMLNPGTAPQPALPPLVRRRTRQVTRDPGSTAPDPALVTSAIVTAAIVTAAVVAASPDRFNNAGRNRQQGQRENNEHSNFHDLTPRRRRPIQGSDGLNSMNGDIDDPIRVI